MKIYTAIVASIFGLGLISTSFGLEVVGSGGVHHRPGVVVVKTHPNLQRQMQVKKIATIRKQRGLHGNKTVIIHKERQAPLMMQKKTVRTF